jgi:hypothetical protein
MEPLIPPDQQSELEAEEIAVEGKIRSTNRWMLGVSLAVFFGCGIFVLVPVWTDSHPVSAGTQCLSNIKQISTATAIYLSDSNDRLPPENWISVLKPYTLNDDLANCPEVSENGNQFGYAYKFGLRSRDVSKLSDPENTVLYFETDALSKNVVANLAARSSTRHKTAVSFLDTHAKRLPADAKLK